MRLSSVRNVFVECLYLRSNGGTGSKGLRASWSGLCKVDEAAVERLRPNVASLLRALL